MVGHYMIADLKMPKGKVLHPMLEKPKGKTPSQDLFEADCVAQRIDPTLGKPALNSKG